jgi:pimeloyl-ACP methyl ester carboxylesterase
MKISLLSMPAFFLLCLSCACASAAVPTAGKWQGTLVTPQGDLTVVVLVDEKTATPTAVMRSLDQPGNRDIPLTITELDDARFNFDAPTIAASFAGNWDEERKAWVGIWSQSGLRLSLTLQRSAIKGTLVAGLDGVWESAVEREGRRMRLILRVKTVDGATTARFDAPDAGANNLSVSGLAREGARIRFSVPSVGARFDGALDGARMSGNWFFPHRPDVKIAFTRTRETASNMPRARPQTPQAPFPYRVEQVHFDNPAASGVRLAATLTLPVGTGPFSAAVLLTGSGAQDRDETIFGHKPFAVLADHLTRNGIAVLRYDDRGFGASTGNFASATSWDFASDAGAAIAYLASRGDIDSAAVGLIGHSEGGLVATLAASGDPRIGFLVLLAAPATDMRRVLLAQYRLSAALTGVRESEFEAGEPIIAQVLDAAAQEGSEERAAQAIRAALTPAADAALYLNDANREFFVQLMSRPWARELVRLDPSIYLAKLRMPVLALFGSLDWQVAPAPNLRAMRESLRDNPDATTREVPGVNHLFQTAKSGGIGEYADIEETIAPAVLEMISSWIRPRFGARASLANHR